MAITYTHEVYFGVSSHDIKPFQWSEKNWFGQIFDSQTLL